jgi:hypothetical protein
LNLSSEELVSKFAFKCNLYRYSAVAVAAALEGVDFAVGTDSGGSVRIPVRGGAVYKL